VIPVNLSTYWCCAPFLFVMRWYLIENNFALAY
jgi:hypothetical protein